MKEQAGAGSINRQHLAAVVLLSGTIALIAPFDVLFDAAAAGSPLRSVALIAAIALSGTWFASQSGLKLELHGPGRPAMTALMSALAMAAYVLLLDCLLFRSSLDPGYVAFLDRPLGERLQYFMLRAFNENVIYRLFGFSLLAWLLQRQLAGKVPSQLILLIAMVASQAINIGFNVLGTAQHPPSAFTFCYDALRYIVPGVAWALLFRRHGFAAAEIASVGTHLFLQPGFSLLL